jgi:hypothetical protein
MVKTKIQTRTRRPAKTVPNISIASDSKDFPIAWVAVTSAVFGNTNENLARSAVPRELQIGDVPSHVKADVVLWVIGSHDLPMSSNTYQEEPET